MRALQPRELVILATYGCTAACRHCCMRSGPRRRERMSWQQMERVVRQARAELGPVLTVFTGGEPLLLRADLLRAVELCSELGMPTRVVTNGFFARTPAAAREVLRELREAGLHDINLSSDDWHLPWVSIQRLRNAYEAALEIGFASVVLAVCYGPGSTLTPQSLNAAFAGGGMVFRYGEEDQCGRLDPAAIEAARAGIVSNPRVLRIGRGAEHLDSSEVFEEDGGVEALAGGCAWAMRAPAVTPSLHLVSCCGFEVEGNPILDYGSLEDHDLCTLLDRADQDLPTNAIALIGPPRLSRILSELCPGEVDFSRRHHGSYCDVCHDLVMRAPNRRALYRHAAAFAPYVMAARHRLLAAATCSAAEGPS